MLNKGTMIFIFQSFARAVKYQVSMENVYKRNFPHVTSRIGVYEGNRWSVNFKLHP